MRPDLLHVVTCVANPIRYASRIKLYRAFEAHMLDSGVHLTTVECAYGEWPHELGGNPAVNHVPVRAKTLVWNKECLLNLGISRLPADARYIAWIDADVTFRRPDWAAETVHALQIYDVVQPWTHAYDLGPHDEHIATHACFARQMAQGKPLCPNGDRWWKGEGGPYEYPHSGYAWAATRQALEWVGGLLEIGGMGSGDHHMALGLAGLAEASMPPGTPASYRAHVMRWQDRARQHIAGNVGWVGGTIEHGFHGRKQDRFYLSRWDMFVQHGFDPDSDLKRNTWGVLELAGNKPGLRAGLDAYFRARNEDINSL